MKVRQAFCFNYGVRKHEPPRIPGGANTPHDTDSCVSLGATGVLFFHLKTVYLLRYGSPCIVLLCGGLADALYLDGFEVKTVALSGLVCFADFDQTGDTGGVIRVIAHYLT